MITSEEWEKEWLSVDRDQLTELLKSNDLVLSSMWSTTNFYMNLHQILQKNFCSYEELNKTSDRNGTLVLKSAQILLSAIKMS